MSLGVVFAVVFVLALMWARRRARAATLAGRNSERPTYAVAPPERRVGNRRVERL